MHRVLSEARAIVERAQAQLGDQFGAVDDSALYNQQKVLDAFSSIGVVAGHMQPSTGYGYGDIGRDTLERLFACTFEAEDAIVRPHIVSGTHALSIGLNGLLEPGQTLLCATGKPYDTLEQVIGIEPARGSLLSRGIGYQQIQLMPDGDLDLDALGQAIVDDPSIAVVSLQRSAGYAWRQALTLEQIEAACALVHSLRRDCLVFVDNCYGEFTCESEPTTVGADLMAGSLIKNAGGGLAPTGGYLCGSFEAIEKVEHALTAPGIGRACGSYEASYRPFYQGLFLAPHVVAQAVKTALLFAASFEQLGFEVMPKAQQQRSDIIQAIRFGNREGLLAFCRAIQSAAPIDSMAVPEPWAMPGYTHEVVMAAGAFVQGSSIELSADGPLCEPYIGYLQGGLTYEHGKLSCLRAVSAMLTHEG